MRALVAQRMRIIDDLERSLFAHGTAHGSLGPNPWIFDEAFNLCTLACVPSGRQGARVMEAGRSLNSRCERLVIGIPESSSAVQGRDDLYWIEDMAIEAERREPGTRWYFWLVCHAYDAAVAARINGGPDPSACLVLRTNTVQIGVRSWSGIIQDNRTRLQTILERPPA